jgi:gamma-glutamyltranspeptidase / glutathione hydrolase
VNKFAWCAAAAALSGAACSHIPFLNRSYATGAEVPARVPAEFPSTWKFPSGRTATFAPNGMVSANERNGSEAGAEILRAGGNAVDAAVATAFALAVSFPEAGNLGGGGFMVIRMADGRTAALDYRETAPAAATRNMYLDAAGNATDGSLVGRLASGVPGSVAGLAEALRSYGTMSLAQVLAPAIRLAEEGVVVDTTYRALLLNYQKRITQYAGSSVFYPNGEAPTVGSTLKLPELAATLRLIARDGPSAFYRGVIADQIVAEMSRDCDAVTGSQAVPSVRRCGIITKKDLAAYRAEWRRPIRTTYRGYALLTMPPSSSGGITVSETLNILEGFDSLPSFGSVSYRHLLREALQRSFIDRNTELADPAFVSIPLVRLTSKTYAEGLRKTIDPVRARPAPTVAAATREGMETTPHAVVDKWGNAVSVTTTLNSLFGNGVYIRGAGFFMNNTMDDFAAKPGSPNQFGLVQGEQNAVGPGKRALSAMSPTIVLDPRGQLFLLVGGRGGPRIITSVAQIILNVIDHRMSLADAMSAPRIHHQWLPDSTYYETGGLTPDVVAALNATGHNMLTTSGVAINVGIMRVKGGWEGMDDPRSRGAAVGY